jgi:hypothetical protein
MISEKQLAANRENAQVSTGPKTDEGKAVVAQNARKHGIFCRITESGEERTAYEEMQAGLVEGLQPVGQMEHLLVEKIGVDQFRLGRLLAYEAGAVRIEARKLQGNMESSHGRSRQKYWDSDVREPVPLEFMKYTDEITDADIAAQTALIVRFRDQEHPLDDDDRALQFVYRTRVDEDRQRRRTDRGSTEPVVKLDKPLPLDWREQAKACFGRLNASQKGRLRSEILPHEEQVLEEMKAVKHVREMVVEHMPLHLLPPDDKMDKILKYETALQRSIGRNMELLQKLQAARAKRAS